MSLKRSSDSNGDQKVGNNRLVQYKSPPPFEFLMRGRVRKEKSL